MPRTIVLDAVERAAVNSHHQQVHMPDLSSSKCEVSVGHEGASM